MTIDLQATLAEVETAAQRKRTAVTIARPDDHWSGSDLARAIERAVTYHRSARRLADTEQEAIGQAVAEKVFRAKGLERVASEYLTRAVSTVLESRSWQDTAERYLTARERQTESGPMIVAAGDALETAGHLAAAVQSQALEVPPADVPDLARAVAARLLADDGLLTDVVAHRRVTARLVQAMTVASGTDAGLALADLARSDGRSVNAWAIDATRGAAILTALEVQPADLIMLVRDAARDAGLSRSAVWDRLDLDSEQRAAARAVGTVQHRSGWGGADCIGHGPRSMPEQRERGPIIDAAPFPGLSRPDTAAPASRADRGPTLTYGAPTVRMAPSAPRDTAPDTLAREQRFAATLDRIGAGERPALKRRKRRTPKAALVPLAPVWTLPAGDCGSPYFIHPERGLIRR